MQTRLGDTLSMLVGIGIGVALTIVALGSINRRLPDEDKKQPDSTADVSQLWTSPGQHVYRFPQTNLGELAGAVSHFRAMHPEYDRQTPAVVMPGPAGSYGTYGCVLIFAEPEKKEERKP